MFCKQVPHCILGMLQSFASWNTQWKNFVFKKVITKLRISVAKWRTLRRWTRCWEIRSSVWYTHNRMFLSRVISGTAIHRSWRWAVHWIDVSRPRVWSQSVLGCNMVEPVKSWWANCWLKSKYEESKTLVKFVLTKILNDGKWGDQTVHHMPIRHTWAETKRMEDLADLWWFHHDLPYACTWYFEPPWLHIYNTCTHTKFENMFIDAVTIQVCILFEFPAPSPILWDIPRTTLPGFGPGSGNHVHFWTCNSINPQYHESNCSRLNTAPLQCPQANL